MKCCCLVLVLLVSPLAVAEGFKEGTKKTDLQKFQRTWTVVSLTDNGKTMPAEGHNKARMVVKGTEWIMKMGDRIVEKGTLRIDPAKKPRAIDFTVTEGPRQGEGLPRHLRDPGGYGPGLCCQERQGPSHPVLR